MMELRDNAAGRAVAIAQKAYEEALTANCLSEYCDFCSATFRGPDLLAGAMAKAHGTQPLRDVMAGRGWEPYRISRYYWAAAGAHCETHLEWGTGVCHDAHGTTPGDEKATTPSDEGGQESGEDA